MIFYMLLFFIYINNQTGECKLDIDSQGSWSYVNETCQMKCYDDGRCQETITTDKCPCSKKQEFQEDTYNFKVFY